MNAVYCWRCHRELAWEYFFYCYDCDIPAHFGYWGA
jgi:hypothetical protein